MSSGERASPRAGLPRAVALAAVFLLFRGPLLAAPAEIPVIDAPVGTGVANSAPSAGAAILAPSPLASSIGMAAAPAAPIAVLAAPAAALPVPLAAAAAPLRDDAKAAPFAAARPAAVFGKRVQAGPQETAQETPRARGEPGDGERAWSQSSALFDLSAERADDAAVPSSSAGLPQNHAGKILAKLRRAGISGTGPGAIPGMDAVEWAGPAGHGNSGESTKVRIGGKLWFLKRLGPSPDPVINATPPETRAGNEAGFAAVLRADPQLSRSFSVSPRVNVFRDGKDVFVLSEGLPATGDGESRRQELSADQRADAAIVQLVLGLGDMHGGDVLPLGGGRFGLVDFEKLSRAPLEKATPREIDEQVFLKNFPLVDRLAENDPSLYRARFERWKRDYDGGGRARMDRALSEQGWSRAQREVYLAAVDKNAATYFERLEPYLEYANGWHRRILAARAEAARRAPPPRKGFFGGLFGSGKD